MCTNKHTTTLLALITLLVTQIVSTKHSLCCEDGCKQDDLTLKWNKVKFDFPSCSTKSLFKSSGKFIPKNVIATRAQLVGNKVFFALPRYRKGVPATLATTNLQSGVCSVVFRPFPCWDMQEEGSCKSLQSAVDIVADQHNILWVLDTGIVESLESPLQKCPAKILGLSTKTGKVLHSISLEHLTTPSSRLQYILVDYDSAGNCYIYVSDAANRAIIVYNLQMQRGFRVLLPKTVTGAKLARDVLYIALVRRDYTKTEVLFTYLEASRLYTVRTEYLRAGMLDGRMTDLGEKPAPMALLGTDNGSSVFLHYEGGSDIYRWHVNSTFNEANMCLVHRTPACQLATHVITDYKHNTMRILQSGFPDFMLNRVGCGISQELTVIQGPKCL